MAKQSNNRKIRILFITYNITGKGTFLRALGFARELAQYGFHVEIISTSPKNLLKKSHIKIDNIPVIEMPDFFPSKLRSGWGIWATLYRCFWSLGQSYDIVHAFENRPAVIFPSLIQKSKRAKLYTDWCDWLGSGGSVELRTNKLQKIILKPFETFFEVFFRRFANGTSVISTTLYKKAQEANAKNIMIIRNGIDHNRLKRINTSKAKKELKLDKEYIYIAHVGAIFSDDAKLLVDAFLSLQKAIENVRLLIIGHCNFKFNLLIKDQNLFIQTGPISNEELNLFLNATDLFWIILKNNNANKGRLPLKATDLLHFGKPIIYTDVGDLSSLMPKNFSIKCSDNPDEISLKSKSLLQNRSLINEMQMNALSFNDEDFSWWSKTKQLLTLYEVKI